MCVQKNDYDFLKHSQQQESRSIQCSLSATIDFLGQSNLTATFIAMNERWSRFASVRMTNPPHSNTFMIYNSNDLTLRIKFKNSIKHCIVEIKLVTFSIYR